MVDEHQILVREVSAADPREGPQVGEQSLELDSEGDPQPAPVLGADDLSSCVPRPGERKVVEVSAQAAHDARVLTDTEQRKPGRR